MQSIKAKLEKIKTEGNYRILRDIDHILEKNMINIASNDYLGLADNNDLIQNFYGNNELKSLKMTSASSRLLTGNHSEYIKIEQLLEELYKRNALFFGSGYHANSGIIPALCDKNTLILADKLSHASMIDGIRLSEAKTIRYRHNDYDHLEKLIIDNHNVYQSIVVITESIFSMDGDEADLEILVNLKKRYPNVFLYIDEAHAVGVRGSNGLGCCEEKGLINEVDFIIGTCGKALASTGAYIICDDYIKDYLINSCRTFIFTTALAPINVAWTKFIIQNLPSFSEQRANLKRNETLLKDFLKVKNIDCQSNSHIIPIIIGESERAIHIAEKIRTEGFFVLPVRPPTVPVGTARLRLSLSASISEDEIKRLINVLDEVLN